MHERPFIAVYMMSNCWHGTIYTGVSSNLPERARQHREGLIKGFTRKYGLKRLVWFEPHSDMPSAIQREKSLKKYKREWKINLIERDNPYWIDLYPALISGTEEMGGRYALRFAPGRPAMTD
jgi:putative endonuclease